MGTGVREVSDVSGSAGYWIAGETTPRMKSTSATRSATTALVRSPANAPSRRAGRMCSGSASCTAQTCAVVATAKGR